MALNTDSALEHLTRIVQVIGSDQKLRQWFADLAHKSLVERRNEIHSTSERMRQEGEDADLVASFLLLADPRVFYAACAALREL